MEMAARIVKGTIHNQSIVNRRIIPKEELRYDKRRQNNSRIDAQKER